MENARKMSKKLKSVSVTQSNATKSNAFAYKHFNSAGNKRRKNRKKYFEHDTRTRTIRTIASPNGTAAIKKIKFNNEINIFETKANGVTTELDMNKCKTKKKSTKQSMGQKKRAFRNRRGGGNGGGNAPGASNIQSTTKRLQKQLIETQKKLQQQLNALQEHQREQNNSFLALLQSNCMHTNAIAPNSNHSNNHGQNSDGSAHHDHNSLAHLTAANDSNSSHFNQILNQNPNTHTKTHCSETFYPIFTDQSKCSIDKMANGNKATAIRPFTCDSKSKNCTVSIDPEAKSFTPPKDLCNHHYCNSCIGYAKTSSGDSNVNVNKIAGKKAKIHIKKPLLKSIILSTNKSLIEPLHIKRELVDNDAGDDDDEDDDDDGDEDEDGSTCETHSKGQYNSIVINTECSTPRAPEPKLHTEMQFTDTKKTKQINSYFKSNDSVQQNVRSYSPPLPATHRLASMVTSDSHQTGNIESRRSRSSRDRKSRSKKRKKRRRSYSRGSRSRSRSYTRSRTLSKSRSRTRSRTHSRSRSYRRRSSRSRSSSSEYYSHRHSQDRKKKSHSKNRDVFRRSTKRDEKGCACNCNCTKNCKKSTKHSNSKTKSKSPSNDSALSSKQSNLSPTDNKRFKRITTTTTDANGSTSKKKPIPISSGVLLKQQPIVKLHSSPVTGSDTENEVDDKFDRKYEELLTFETNEDERREQRLLKALSDIAAKAKQKIQSITEPNMAKDVPADRNHNNNNERSAPKPNKLLKHTTNKSNELRDERHTERPLSEDRYDNDFSPRERKQLKRASSRRSRRDSSCSSSSSKDAKSPRSSRSPSIPRRRGSPSFLDRRRITSARKKPIPYTRSSPYDSYDEYDSP